MVQGWRFIYGKLLFGFQEKFGFFRYCTGKLPEGSGGFRRGPEVRKMFHHVQYSSMGCRGRPNLNGPRAPAPPRPMRMGEGKP